MKIIPVIHFKDEDLAFSNAELCAQYNTYGIFLISMDGDNEGLCALARKIKNLYPKLKVGVNLLGNTALNGIFDSMNYGLDMTWSDSPVVTSHEIKPEAYLIANEIKNTEHMFFNSVAFKYQKEETNLSKAVLNSKLMNFIPTTSGEATGKAAELSKLHTMKEALKDYPLAIASGLTPSNVVEYIPYIEYGLVATGISEDFYTFDRLKMGSITRSTK